MAMMMSDASEADGCPFPPGEPSGVGPPPVGGWQGGQCGGRAAAGGVQRGLHGSGSGAGAAMPAGRTNRILPFCHSANLPICQSANLPICQSANLPNQSLECDSPPLRKKTPKKTLKTCHSAILPFCHSSILPFCHFAILPFCHFSDLSTHRHCHDFLDVNTTG